LELVGLAVLVEMFHGWWVDRSCQPIIRKRKENVYVCKEIPRISLLVLAMIFGTAPAFIVAMGLLSPAWSQLGALSASLAAIVLVLIEGRLSHHRSRDRYGSNCLII
jgi:hypothetical protein